MPLTALLSATGAFLPSLSSTSLSFSSDRKLPSIVIKLKFPGRSKSKSKSRARNAIVPSTLPRRSKYAPTVLLLLLLPPCLPPAP